MQYISSHCFFVSVLPCKGMKKQKVNVYFVSLIYIASTVMLLLLQAKAHTHTTQVKAPFTEGTRVLSFPLQRCILVSWFSTPPTAEGACLCCLTWIWMWGADVGFTLLILNLLRASDTCKLEWNRDLGHSCVFLPVYFTCELPQNLILQPTTISWKNYTRS